MDASSRRAFFKNAAANYAGAFFLAAMPLVALPVYVEVLGELQWALVGVALTLQALLAVLDAGASQILVREFSARLGSAGTAERSGALLLSCQRFYMRCGMVVGAAGTVLAFPIARFWLDLPPQHHVLGALSVAGGAFLCSFYLPGVLYRAVAIAGQRHVELNVIVSLGAILRFGGGAIVVWYWPHLAAYLLWNLTVMGLELAARRRLAWRTVGPPAEAVAGSDRIRVVLGSMGIWTIAAAVGAATTQMDRIVLSAMLPVGTLASYFVASQIALGVLQVFAPLIMAMLPTLLSVNHDAAERSRKQLLLACMLFLLSVIVLSSAWLLGPSVLRFAFGEVKAVQIMPVMFVLLLGVCCNALCNVGYIEWLAKDRRFRLLIANSGAFVIVVALSWKLVPHLGPVGAAYAWAIAQLSVLVWSLGWIFNAYKNR